MISVANAQDKSLLFNIIQRAVDYAEHVHFCQPNAKGCRRKAVGIAALSSDAIFHRNRIEWGKHASLFFNGSGQVHCTNERGNCGCVHAEVRAVLAATRRHEDILLLQNYSPCTNCANLIVESQVVLGVYWLIDTDHDMRGIDILHRGNVACGRL
jgi:deoxycytidylate deaminase